MDHQKVISEAVGSLANGTTFKRSQIFDYLVQKGYAERTAQNALTPSRVGGMVHKLLRDGVIEPDGPLSYRIVNSDGFKPASIKNKGRVMKYKGAPKEDWRSLGVMSDEGAYECEIMLCGERYAKGCWNLKAYAQGEMAHKANWWMQYRHGKLFGNDAIILRERMPDVYQNILTDMREIEDAEC
jgi:hypothetical protein